MTVASGSVPEVAEVGKNKPDAVFCRMLDKVELTESEKHTVSGLNRWTSMRSKRGITDLMDLNVAACKR